MNFKLAWADLRPNFQENTKKHYGLCNYQLHKCMYKSSWETLWVCRWKSVLISDSNLEWQQSVFRELLYSLCYWNLEAKEGIAGNQYLQYSHLSKIPDMVINIAAIILFCRHKAKNQEWVTRHQLITGLWQNCMDCFRQQHVILEMELALVWRERV